jgi:hypothetical protein
LAKFAVSPLLTAASSLQEVEYNEVGDISRQQATLSAHQIRVWGSLPMLWSSALKGRLNKAAYGAARHRMPYERAELVGRALHMLQWTYKNMFQHFRCTVVSHKSVSMLQPCCCHMHPCIQRALADVDFWKALSLHQGLFSEFHSGGAAR